MPAGYFSVIFNGYFAQERPVQGWGFPMVNKYLEVKKKFYCPGIDITIRHQWRWHPAST